MSFGELAKACRLNRVGLSAAGYYKTPEISWDRAAVKGKPFFYFAYRRLLRGSRDRYADRRDEGARRSTSCTTSAPRSIRRSTSARSRAPSCRAWAG